MREAARIRAAGKPWCPTGGGARPPAFPRVRERAPNRGPPEYADTDGRARGI